METTFGVAVSSAGSGIGIWIVIDVLAVGSGFEITVSIGNMFGLAEGKVHVVSVVMEEMDVEMDVEVDVEAEVESARSIAVTG